jgi:hypothetical protein
MPKRPTRLPPEEEALMGRTDLLSQERFAEHVGVSAHEIYTLHQQGYFKAACAGGKGRGKQRLYTPEQVVLCRQFLKGRSGPSSRVPAPRGMPFSHFGDITAEDARKGFQALRAGKKLEDLVLDEGLHPDTVVSLTLAWSKLSGALFVSRETLDKISLLTLDGPLPIVTEADLLEVLTIASDDNLCTTCRKQKRSTCKKCLANAVFQGRQEEREKATRPVSNGANLHEDLANGQSSSLT